MLGTNVVVSGIEEIDARLQYLGDKSARRIGRACAKKIVSTYARAIRRFVPRSIAPSTTDKGIGSRGMRSKGPRVYAAKAGIGVGGAQKSALNVVNRGQRKGKGVTAKNLHWFALGTQDRFTGSRKSGAKQVSTGAKRRFTGRLDKQKFGGFVQKGVTASDTLALAQAQQLCDRMIGQEVDAARNGA